MEKNSSAPPPGFNPGLPPYPYPQPPPSMPPPSMPPQSVTIISGMAFGKETQNMTCPHCQANITTRVESESNMKTHLIALLLCALGCWCCVPCPYCMDSCLMHKHYCPACGTYLGMSDN
ncbi:cell death-inducing p53-target protein 1-like [Pseudomyrmex gracilis]|uniref:cell death-inducing p53-target protein 1-like n=1 Tax=Pseudomyrmex gracilis TaxID=219809 RepID=UPI0009951ABA|nr:cell death-inducing p53-target protein 1-like [Pseudomyrmex gracilis]